MPSPMKRITFLGVLPSRAERTASVSFSVPPNAKDVATATAAITPRPPAPASDPRETRMLGCSLLVVVSLAAAQDLALPLGDQARQGALLRDVHFTEMQRVALCFDADDARLEGQDPAFLDGD